ncbi:hypothetical protein [Ruegeria sp.]|uniref:hypothetical protein n=1 Tax=Ruegeria sp. TaxID=1879320 RepID=UPI003B5AEA47
MQDLMNNIHPVRAISPVSVSDDTAQVSEIIDLQGYDSLTFVILTGALGDADATFAVLVEEGDDPALSDAAAVADVDLIGTEALAGFQFDDDDETRKIGYSGGKRYVRLTVTPAANASAALLAAVALLGHPSSAPTANPPV